MGSSRLAKILVVDDEIDWRNTISRIVDPVIERKNQYFATDHNEAMELIDRHYFHAAILDTRLVHEDNSNDQGMRLLKYLYDKEESTGCIMLTGYATPQRVIDAWKAYNARNFFEKQNFDHRALQIEVDNALTESETFLQRSRKDSLALNYIAKSVDLNLTISKLSHQMQENFQEALSHFVSLTSPYYSVGIYESLIESEGSFVFLTKLWSRFKGCALGFAIGTRQAIQAQYPIEVDSTKDVERFTVQTISAIQFPIEHMTIDDFRKSNNG